MHTYSQWLEASGGKPTRSLREAPNERQFEDAQTYCIPQSQQCFALSSFSGRGERAPDGFRDLATSIQPRVRCVTCLPSRWPRERPNRHTVAVFPNSELGQAAGNGQPGSERHQFRRLCLICLLQFPGAADRRDQFAFRLRCPRGGLQGSRWSVRGRPEEALRGEGPGGARFSWSSASAASPIRFGRSPSPRMSPASRSGCRTTPCTSRPSTCWAQARRRSMPSQDVCCAEPGRRRWPRRDPYAVIASFQLYDAKQKYLTDTGHFFDVIVFAASKTMMDQLLARRPGSHQGGRQGWRRSPSARWRPRMSRRTSTCCSRKAWSSSKLTPEQRDAFRTRDSSGEGRGGRTPGGRTGRQLPRGRRREIVPLARTLAPIDRVFMGAVVCR